MRDASQDPSSCDELREHLLAPVRRAHVPAGPAFTGAAGGAACGDLVRISLAVAPDDPHGTIVDSGFDARGCAAAIAAGSAAVALVDGRPLLQAARVGADEIAAELGGLTSAGLHAAQLAADALHRALGGAARRGVRLHAPAGDDARTLVAMSGGVDSAVAAVLAGTRAVAVTVELWADPDNDGERSCCSAEAVRSARALAHRLGMAHFSIDLRAEFRAGVVDPWLAGHAAGLTPNPCVRCNGEVRLDAMLDLADRLGAGALATGHYARIVRGGDAGPLAGGCGPRRRVAADTHKDQSYMLAALAPAALARLRFPLGELRKPEVRERARAAGLPVHRKPDSQDLCFLAGTGREAFLARHGGLGTREGAIVDAAGREVGRHAGAHRFTVGQRRGLGVGGRPEPVYVLATDAAANTVTIGPRTALATVAVGLRDVTLHRDAGCVDAVRLRYRSRALGCRVRVAATALAGGGAGEAAARHARASLELAQPAFGVAPGQLACLLSGDVVVGHATIAA